MGTSNDSLLRGRARDVLVVDDESAVSSLLTMALQRTYPDRAVKVVRSAEEALSVLERESFALMILDQHLPGASGFDLFRKMRALKYRVPAILLTGFFTPETAELASSLGILQSLPKPLVLADLMQAVARALGAVAAYAPTPTPLPLPAMSPDGGELILIVDDEPSVRLMLSKLLAHHGYRVTLMEDAESAMDQLARERPDVVLLDVNLPGMNGIALAKRLRVADAALPVVLITGSPELVDPREVDAVGCLSKPFTSLGTVLAVVKEACRASKRRRARLLKTTAQL